ncbi:MAG: hypothetical protein H7256_14335 [Bdellovibrio sp.]|nr:hypothetical protein [Bdellovibrio sp.]
MSDIQSTAEADRILNQDKVEQKGLDISPVEKKKMDRTSRDEDDDSDDDDLNESGLSKEEIEAREIQEAMQLNPSAFNEEEEEFNFDAVENILDLPDTEFPRFTLAKNKARFLRMVSWYRQKEEWIEVAPVSGVTKLFKQQSKELEGIRSSKLDYEMELETGTLTPSQRSYRRDELKMCRVQEKMAVHLISKLQIKIKSGRR